MTSTSRICSTIYRIKTKRNFWSTCSGTYQAKKKEYWSKHYRNYGTKNRVADRAMRERKKPDVEKALSMFKNPQQAAHLAWLLENKKNNRS